MTKHDPIDVEVTHVEEHGDEFQELEHPEIDPEMTSGIAIVTPEQYIERTPERRAAEEEQMGSYTFSKDEAKLAVIAIPDDRLPVQRVDPHGADHLEWAEDYSVLRVLFSKVFRRAIIAGAELPQMPNIEAVMVETHGEQLGEVYRDLNEAQDGKDDVSVRLAEWKVALSI